LFSVANKMPGSAKVSEHNLEKVQTGVKDHENIVRLDVSMSLVDGKGARYVSRRSS